MNYILISNRIQQLKMFNKVLKHYMMLEQII